MGYHQPDTLQSSCIICSATKYCLGGTSGEIDCIVGHFCPEGTRFSNEFPCEAGTFASTTGKETCDPCTAGYMCEPGSDNANANCPGYSYCP